MIILQTRCHVFLLETSCLEELEPFSLINGIPKHVRYNLVQFIVTFNLKIK